MNERQMQFRVGVVVFATMIIGGVLFSLSGPMSIGWLPWGRSKYMVGIRVPQAPGVDTHTPVRKNGILIGRVKSIEDQEVGVIVHAEVNGDRPLYAEYEPHIRTTVLGDATIDFLSRQPAAGSQPVADGFVFNNGRVDPNPFDSLAELGDLKEEFAYASRSIGEAGEEFGLLAKRINEALGEDSAQGGARVGRMVDSAERAMNQITQLMTAVNEIIGDEPAGVQPSVVQPPGQVPTTPIPPAGAGPTEGQQLRRRMRQGLNDLPVAMQEFRATMQEARAAVQSADRNFKNMEAFTESLGASGDAFTDSLLRTVTNLDKLVADVNGLIQVLNNRESGIGKLLHDPQLSNNLNTLMYNANRVLAQIHQLGVWLEPVVKDARIFMDKVAREPGRIGLGNLNPSPVK